MDTITSPTGCNVWSINPSPLTAHHYRRAVSDGPNDEALPINSLLGASEHRHLPSCNLLKIPMPEPRFLARPEFN
ncbi:hypothetical protein LIA77_02223 [Sarocladium implicatum]|nr:hypothetical protein LIA77_02223 [Sarocladium implicatum]